MDILINLLVFVVVLGLVWWLITMLPLPAPMRQIAQVIVVIICLLAVLSLLFGGVPLPFRMR